MLCHRYIIEPILPAVDDRVFVDSIDIALDALFELSFRLNANPTLLRGSHFSKEGLHQVEPRAVLGGKHKLEAVGKGRQIGAGLLGDVRGMVVEHETDCRPGRIADRAIVSKTRAA